MHFALENTLGGVVLDEVGKIVSRNEIVDCDDFVSFFKEPLFDAGTEDEAADAAEPIDGNIWPGDGYWMVAPGDARKHQWVGDGGKPVNFKQ